MIPMQLRSTTSNTKINQTYFFNVECFIRQKLRGYPVLFTSSQRGEDQCCEVTNLHCCFSQEWGDLHGVSLIFTKEIPRNHWGPGTKKRTSYLDVMIHR